MSAVLVVGNGPVGQTTALLLARWGIPTVVVDRRPERDLVGSRSICQQRDVLDIWDCIGVGRQIADEGVTWTRARTFHGDRELFAATFEDRGRSAFPPFVNISQARTEQILDTRIADQPLIDVRWSHDVVDIATDADGVTVECRTPEGTARIRGPYAVLCAGGRCDPLRDALGVGFEGRSFDDHFLICDIRTDLPTWQTERRFYFDPVWNPGRQVLIHPCPGSTFRIDWQVAPGHDLAAEQRSGALDRRIRQIIGDPDYEIVWSSVYRPHSRIATRMRAGRVLLAGDAAHLMAPFGARGLNSGVQDAENLAWKLAYVLRGHAPDRLLDSYDSERRAAAVENLEITDTTMDFLAPRTTEQRERRRQTLQAAATDPGARARVDSGRLAEPYWYIDSPLTTPDPSRPFSGRPPKGHTPAPAPGILLPDLPVRMRGAPGRLRTLLRDGPTVLAGRAVEPEPIERAPGDPADPPVRVLSVPTLHSDDLADVLRMRDDELWLVRPDAHVAAVVRDVDSLNAARARLLGYASRDAAAQ